ncbi:MAG TPA: helix-hairpin-helix domain-containing protein, partial [Chitinophagales bacterium]|nr:helix-hairpin-helix domain-containing protein [Chitinophagales bacterium]
DPLPLYINKKSESLRVIQQLRDEAHRFAITFHRQKRSKSAIKSELDDIKGIGRATASNLLKAFKSVKNIRNASIEALSEVVGQAKAQIIIDHFHTTGESSEA